MPRKEALKMPGGSTASQNQTQASQTSPYAPTQPLLNNILSGLGGTSTAPTTAQTQGIQELESNAQTAPQFGGQATGVANTLLSGGPTNYSGILNSGYSNLQNELTPIADGSMVGNNTALQGELNTMGNQVQNQVNSEFAAAGRPIGTNADASYATALGISQGEAPVIAGQYNQDVANQMSAANSLEGAANTTASGLTGITQTQLGNEEAGLGAATAVPGILNQNANSLLQAGTAEQALPYSGYGLQESLVNPIAGLGAQSTGTSTGSTTQQASLGSTIAGGLLGGLGLLGGTGLLGSAGGQPTTAPDPNNPGGYAPSFSAGTGLLGWMYSDERLKDDVERIGILNDATPIYSFTYKFDPTYAPHIGVMAQDIERQDPEAVREIGGFKAVNYGRVADRARVAGILSNLQAAI
jgi:hypothetical protein